MILKIRSKIYFNYSSFSLFIYLSIYLEFKTLIYISTTIY